ncbi:MAG: hypothetical protein K2L72_01795, partial [Clostridia bacterium]|nr:hypothetical protein [Clostridia bacterium]
LKVDDERNRTMYAVIDYSVVDKDIDIIGVPTPPANDDSGTTTETNPTNFWLLAASIILVAAILVAIAAIFIRFMIKKFSRKRTAGKNSYNFNKNTRYVKKYVKANGEAPVIAEGEVDESLLTDASEEVKSDESAETKPEEVKPDEGTEAESSQENTATEDVKETDEEISGNNSEETPSEGSEDKPEGKKD